MANALKRVLSLTLALLMVVSLLPSFALSADAATLSGLTDTSIGLEYTAAKYAGTVSWTAAGNQITGSVTGKTNSKGTSYAMEESTLTITNNKNEAAILNFDFSISMLASGSTVTIAGTEYVENTTGSFGPVEVGAGETVEIKIYSPQTKKTGSNNTTITLSNVALVVQRTVETTFMAVDNATFTVNGEVIAEDTVMQNDSVFSYTLSITPDAGYKFVGWYNETTGAYFAETATVTNQYDTDYVIYPVVVSEDTAVFMVGDEKFTDLGEAAEYASKDGADDNIVLISDGTLTGDYTIPAGETLLIPFDDAYTCYTDAPEVVDTYSVPAAYKTLTIAPGASITVNGTMSVSAPHTACKGGSVTGGSPSGAAGFVKMEGDSAILVNDGGILYAWGFIYGSGSVTCESGAKVYEYMQVTDFRGGSATLDMKTVFPFSQYYVQNVEVPLVLKSGAEEYVFTSITVSGITMGMPVRFIGTTNAMFVSKGGTITKEYLTDKDRLEVTVSGDAALNSIVLELPPEFQTDEIKDLLASAGFEDGISSENYILSLNGNITINIESGTTSLAQDLALLPGFELYLGKNAVLELVYGESMTAEFFEGYNVMVYDADDWGNYVHSNRKFQAVYYAPGRTYTRTESDLKDAVLDINGTVITNGFLYTTSGGAAITSSEGTGVIILVNGAGEETETVQAVQISSVTYDYIAIDSAKLLNADGTYTETAGAEAGATFIYQDGKWVRAYTVTWCNEDGTILATDVVAEGATPAYTGATPTKSGDVQFSYTFSGWTPAVAAVTGDVTYTAVFEATTNSYTVTWKNADGTVLATDQVAYGTVPSYTGATPTKAATQQYSYTFAGWDTTPVAVTGDATYTAVFTESLNKYTVTWCNEDGTVLAAESVEYGTVPSYTGATPTKAATAEYSYTFAGWNTTPGEVKGDVTYTATYTASKNSYTITWVNEDGTVLDQDTVAYGETPVYSGETPTKAATAEYSYVFNGWTTKVVPVTGDAVYTAAYKQTERTYNVTWIVDGVETVEAYSVGSNIVVPADPAKEGHTFAGWDATVPATMPAKDLTFTAKWTVNNYTVTWIVDGKETVVTYAYGAAVETVADPAKEGYTFTGWSATVPATMPAENLTFTAQWKINEYTVTWIVDGKETVVTYAYGAAVEAVADPAKEGHTFAGWDATVPATMPAKDLTFTAKWTVNNYTVTWIVDGEETVVTYVYGAAVETVADPAKEGYTFTGWDATVPATMPAKDLTFTAEWKINEYTVTWIVDGKETVVTYAYGAAVETVADPAKEGHTFAGWSAIAPETMPAKNLTFVAQWTVNKYTVTWIVDGEETVVSYAYGAAVTAAADPAKEGYTFTGWSATVPATMPAKDLTFTAQWKINEYTVTWIVDGTETVVTYAYGAAVETAADPAKEGHTFAGWDATVPATMPAENLTFTAKWTVNEYTVTFADEDGTVLSAGKVPYGTVPTEPNAPTKAATAEYTYTFAGWDKEVAAVTGDVTYTAIYTAEKNTYEVVFKNVDGTVLVAGFLEYGAMPSYTGDEPTKASTEMYSYVFAGWDQEFAAVTGNVTYTAVYTQVVNFYTVTWIIDGVETVDTYMFGENVVIPEAPAKEGYTFNGWSGEIPATMPAEDLCFTADYAINTYTITWTDSDGTVLATQTVEHGTVPVYPNDDPVKTSSSKIYTFTGWSAEIVAATANATYTAVYTEEVKNGFVKENGGIYHYEDGQLTKAGLIWVDGYYYYVKTSSGEVVCDRTYWITYTHDMMPEGSYAFDEEGRMIDPPVGAPEIPEEPEEPETPVEPEEPDVPVEPEEPEEPDVELKNGFYHENGGIYHYIDGELSYAGLIAVDGYFYYVRTTTGEVVTNRTYWITYTNGYMDQGNYVFDEEGRMVGAPVVIKKNGFYHENGGIYHYVDDSLSYAGLIYVDGYYYYVKTTTGEVVTNRTYWITYTNGLMEQGNYEFDSQGRMITDETPEVVKNGFVAENGGIYHYVDGQLSKAGLIEVDGSYYYVKTTTGEVVCGRTYWITYTNDLLPAGNYTFAADGKMILN